jgi:hypothetical protein
MRDDSLTSGSLGTVPRSMHTGCYCEPALEAGSNFSSLTEHANVKWSVHTNRERSLSGASRASG